MLTFFFYNDTATTEIYTLSLHDALPICFRKASSSRRYLRPPDQPRSVLRCPARSALRSSARASPPSPRSEEHTSELQSRQYLVCRLLLEKKKYTSRDLTSARTTCLSTCM